MKKISKKIFAFTLAEVMVVFMVIAVVAAGTIGIQKSRTHYADKFMSYASFTGLKSFVEELIGEGTIRTTELPVNSTEVCVLGTAGCVPCNPFGPNKDANCEPCDLRMWTYPTFTCDTPCNPQDPAQSGCQPCDFTQAGWDQECREPSSGGTADGKFYNSQAAIDKLEAWKNTEEAYISCYNSNIDNNNYNGQEADAACFPSHNFTAAKTAYQNAVASTRTGSCTMTLYTSYNDTYSGSDEYYAPYCAEVDPGTPDRGATGKIGTTGRLTTNETETITETIKALPTTGSDLCNRTMDMLNTTKFTACDKTATDAGPFAVSNANFVTSNGIRYFNFGSNATHIGPTPEASDTNDDNFIFTIYVDSDGAKGKSILGEDVTKFYVSRSGKIFVPAPDSKMATDTSFLSATVRYRIGGNYTKVGERLTFQQATCLAGKNTDLFNSTYNYCPAGMDRHPQCNTASTNLNCEVVLNKPGF